MAVSAAVVSVGTSATLLTVTETDQLPRFTVALYNAGAATVYVGAAGVTTSTGFPLAAAGTLSIDLDRGEVLYGIVTASTCSVNVLSQGI